MDLHEDWCLLIGMNLLAYATNHGLKINTLFCLAGKKEPETFGKKLSVKP
ncbi:MAG: hypothetical protein ACOC4J_03770 [Bacteroidota bacterium]